MNNPAHIPPPKTTFIELDGLYLHPLNTRTEPPALEISQLADSILACGLMQNLLCLTDADGRMGVVAGGRRFRALQLLAAAGQWDAPVPVQVTTDAAVAQTWANAENTARAALHPADEIRAYGRMADTGAAPQTIARAFAVTEAHVKRRLRLAQLPDAALDALKAGIFTLDQCAALTIGDDPERRADVLAALLDSPGYHADWVRRALVAQGIGASDRRARFVGLGRYEAEGGRTTRDLFTDSAWLHDEGLLDRLFARYLADEATFRRTDGGWGFALHTTGAPHDDRRMRDHAQVAPDTIDLPEGDADELEALSELDDPTEAQIARRDELDARANPGFDDEARAGLGIMVHVDWNGKVRIIEGLQPIGATTPDADSGDAQDGDTTAPAPAPDPDISQALREDFLTIRRAALQTALLLKPDLTLDLVAFALDWSERHAGHGLTGIRAERQNVTPSVPGGVAIVGALTPADREDWRTPGAADFAAFRAQDGFKKRRNEILTVHFARSVMAIPGDLTDLLEKLAGAHPRSIWQPDAKNCFGRMSSVAMMEIYRDVLRPADDDARFAAFAAMKKRDQARELDDLFHDLSVREAYGIDRETGARIDAWLPTIMRGAGE